MVVEMVFGGSVGCKLDIVDIVDDVCSYVDGFVDDVDAVVDASWQTWQLFLHWTSI